MPTITGTAGNDILTGTDADDFIFGQGGNDTIDGGDGADVIDAGSGVDTVLGGAGNDTLRVSSVSTGSPPPTPTTFNGGTGIDTFDISSFSLFPQAFWSFDFNSNVISVANYRISQVEKLLGTSGVDIFNFLNINFSIEIHGNGGADQIRGGSRADQLFGGTGDDTIRGEAGDSVYGEEGNDRLTIDASSTALVDGGEGVDTMLLNGSSSTIYLDSQTGFTRYSNIENVEITSLATSTFFIYGSSGDNRFSTIAFYSEGASAVRFYGLGGDDTLIGGGQADWLYGGDGNDRLEGDLGIDIVSGDAGDDFLIGGASNDRLDGGLGIDTASYENHQTLGVSVDLSAGTSAGGADSGDDTLIGVENIRGSDLADTLRGDGGDNRLDGAAGADVLFGGGGNDSLIGGSSADIAEYTGNFADHQVSFQTGSFTVTGAGSGTDTLTGIEQLRFSDRTVSVTAAGGLALVGGTGADAITGTNGADDITGGGGTDTLTGGAGADTFRYLAAADSTAAASDTITDFQAGVDRIDLTALNPSSVSIARLAGGGTVVFAETAGGAFQTFVAGASLNGADFVFNGGFGVFVIGSEGADVIQGTAVPDPLVGNGGDDVITGGAGADAIAGGAGRDVFRYVSRGDSNQQTGFDNLYDFTSSEDRIDLTALNATSISILRTDNGSSFIYAETAQGVFLTTAANRTVQATDITFGSGPNGVGAFGIYMVGSGVNDILVGTSLADPIAGGAGNDTITGGGGADAMFGDGGADTFVYLSASDSTAAASDGIFGFVSGTDRLDLRAVRTGAADTFGIAYLSGGSYLFVDLGGNGTSDLVIGLAGTTLIASDILWNTSAIGEEPGVKAAGPEVLPVGGEGELFDGEMSLYLSPMTGRWMLDLEGARGFHGQDWYL